MTSIVCLKWGEKYGPEYVTKLQSMCTRHIAHDAFVCFTDAPIDGVFCRPLPSDLPGWWAKIGLFRPGLLPGRKLYLDLDVVVTAGITPLLDAFQTDPTRLWALDDFSYSLITPKHAMGSETRRLLGGAGTVNSSVMLWEGDAGFEVWDRWSDSVMDELHGDQNFITRTLWPDKLRLLPSGVAGSYKYGGGQPYPITVFHGEPKPHQVGGWVADHWK